MVGWLDAYGSVCALLGRWWNALRVACGRYNYDDNNVNDDGDKDNVEDDDDSRRR